MYVCAYTNPERLPTLVIFAVCRKTIAGFYNRPTDSDYYRMAGTYFTVFDCDVMNESVL